MLHHSLCSITWTASDFGCFKWIGQQIGTSGESYKKLHLHYQKKRRSRPTLVKSPPTQRKDSYANSTKPWLDWELRSRSCFNEIEGGKKKNPEFPIEGKLCKTWYLYYLGFLVGNNKIWLRFTKKQKKKNFLKRYLITSKNPGRWRARDLMRLRPVPKLCHKNFLERMVY